MTTRSPSGAGGRTMLDAVIVGGGQAGMAVGHDLAGRGANFEILDAGDAPGASWRRRWDSLVLFTPAQYDSLPGMPFPAPRDTYPSKDDVAEYLGSYAERFSLPIRHGVTVTGVRAAGDGFVVASAGAEVEARRVVIATGPFQIPAIPGMAASLDPSVVQVHSEDYRSPASVAGRDVLVVGGGNSGCQIAHELSSAHAVILALGKKTPTLPQRPLGRDLWWWGNTFGLSNATVESRLGRRLRDRDPVIGIGPKRLARDHRVRLRPLVRSASGRTVTFDDGASQTFDAVVWATGYRTDHSWVDVPGAKDADGRLVHRRGVSAADGLFLVGQSWQWRRGSALLGWVGDDARFIVEAMHV
jgi:putative flavoprotein involved in K+ transport